MGRSDFSPRMKQIVLALLKEEKPVSVKYLSAQVAVSKRTVQRELEYLPRALKNSGVEFGSKTGTGVWLLGSAEDKTRLKDLLEGENAPDASDKAERRKRLILEILKDKTLKKLYYYSCLFGVSEATVSSDLEAAEAWFRDCNLKIVKKPGYGVFMEGNETDFRRALRIFIDENINSELIREMYQVRNESVLEVLGGKKEKSIYHVLDDDIVRRVTSCIMNVRDRRILNLTENSYLGLIIHVSIAVNRILNQELIEENSAMVEELRDEPDYILAERIGVALEAEFQMSIPAVECAYICLHMKGAKVQQMEIDDQSKMKVQEARQLWDTVNEMIDCYDKDNAYLLKQDEEFVIQGLIAHLKPTLVRLANGMKIQNPLLEQIKQEYSSIFEKCRQVAHVIEQHYGYEVPEPEIGFLAIHFGAAEVRLESKKESRRRVELGIVCASGIGISRLISSKIARAFADRVEIMTYGMADLTPYVLEKIDFFISTMTLKEDGDILYVSPLLGEEDMERVSRKVRQYEYMPAKRKEQEFTRQLEQVNFVAMSIKGILEQLTVARLSQRIAFEELLLAVSEAVTPYEDRRLLIYEALEKREQLGSQIFPDFGFALFHARTKGVVRPGFSVFLTEEGSAFWNPYFKGIGVVFVMLAPDDEQAGENSRILGFLSEKLVEEEEFLETVRTGEIDRIRQLVSCYLKQYFNQYLDKI